MENDTISYIGTAFVIALLAYPFVRLVNFAQSMI
jgi:hypothetical protein